MYASIYSIIEGSNHDISPNPSHNVILAKTLFFPNQSTLLQLDLKQIMRSPITLVVSIHPRVVPCVCPTFPKFCNFHLFEANHKMGNDKDNWPRFMIQNRLLVNVLCMHKPLEKVQEPHHQKLDFQICENSILPPNLIECVQQATNTFPLYK